MLHIALAVIKAARLLCMVDPDWDPEAARVTFDLQDTLQRLSKHSEAASHVGSPRCKILVDGQPLFEEYAERYRRIGNWYSSKLGPGIVHPTFTPAEPSFLQGMEQLEDFDFWTQIGLATS